MHGPAFNEFPKASEASLAERIEVYKGYIINKLHWSPFQDFSLRFSSYPFAQILEKMTDNEQSRKFKGFEID